MSRLLLAIPIYLVVIFAVFIGLLVGEHHSVAIAEMAGALTGLAGLALMGWFGLL